MHRDDDISRLFQNSQHNLEERPSNRAWQRLEQKLDAKKARHRRLIYRYVSTVAAVIAVLAMITAISVFDFPQNKEMANQTTSETPTIAFNNDDSDRLEEFKKREGIDKSVAELLEEQEVETEEEQGVDIYVEEEDYKSDKTKEQIAQHIPKPKPKPTPSTTTPSSVEKDVIPSNEFEDVVKTTKAEEVITEEEIEVKPIIAPSRTTPPRAKPKSTPVKSRKPSKTLAKKKNKARKAQTTEKTKSARTKETLEISTEAEGYQNKLEEPKINLSKVTLTDFKWLEGEWEDLRKNSDLSSYEKWEKKSRNTLIGEGYLMTPNGRKFFTETIKIRKKGGNIYYYTKLQEDGNLIKFKLIQFDGRMAVFENKDIAFPQQIILEKKGGNTFFTIFQNTQNMSKVQEKQLKHRNNISRERATRMMKRRANSY